MGGSLSSIVFVGDYGKMVMVRTDDKMSQGSLFLPGEIISNIHNVKRKDPVSYVFTDDDNVKHCLMVKENDKNAQCDNEKGQVAVLVLPSLHMAPEDDISERDKSETNPTLVCFTDQRCDDSQLTGGKGSSLGKLSKMEDINVPDGFCITTSFWEELLNEDLKEALKYVEKAAS